MYRVDSSQLTAANEDNGKNKRNDTFQRPKISNKKNISISFLTTPFTRMDRQKKIQSRDWIFSFLRTGRDSNPRPPP